MNKILVLIMIIALFAGGCSKKMPAKAAVTEKKEVVQEQSTGDEIQHKVLAFNLEGLTDRGEKKWEVTGRSAEAVSETEVLLDEIVAKAYGEEAEATITADKGVYNKTKNNVRLEKNVKATIESTQAFAEGYVNFTDVGQGTKPGNDRDGARTKTVITCDGEVQFDYEKNQAYFDKNVKVANEDGNINADRITVNMDPSTKKITEIIANGNVRIKRGDNITYSEKATYIEADKKILLTGKPRLVIYQEGSIENSFFGSK